MRNCRIFSQALSHWICPPAVRVAPFNHFFWGLERLRNLRSLNVASVRLKMSVKFRIMQFRPCSFHGPFFPHVCVLRKETWCVWMITGRSGRLRSCLESMSDPGAVTGILIGWTGGECRKWLLCHIWIHRRKTFAWRLSNKNMIGAYLDLDFKYEICSNSPCYLVIPLLSTLHFSFRIIATILGVNLSFVADT